MTSGGNNSQDGGTIVKILVALIALVGILGLLGILWVRSNPLEVHEWTTRQELARSGLEKTTVEAASGRLVVWRGGSGERELVFLHGAGDQAGAWAKVAPGLATDYRLSVLDLPGHGDSDPASGPLKYSTVLAGVEEYLAGRDGPVILAGHSMGAWLAMVAAHRHPERVARVVAVNGGALKSEPPEGLSLAPQDREQARRTMAALRDPSSPPTPDFVLDDIVRRGGSGPIGRLVQEFADMEAHLLDGKLGEITVPVDLVWGESDRYLDLDYARQMEAELPRARLTLVPKCGHLPGVECPERFLEILRGVLASEPPAGEPPAAVGSRSVQPAKRSE